MNSRTNCPHSTYRFFPLSLLVLASPHFPFPSPLFLSRPFRKIQLRIQRALTTEINDQLTLFYANVKSSVRHQCCDMKNYNTEEVSKIRSIIWEECQDPEEMCSAILLPADKLLVSRYCDSTVLLHCALSCGAVYWNRFCPSVCLFVCVYVCVCLWVCYQDNSKLLHRSLPNWVCR